MMRMTHALFVGLFAVVAWCQADRMEAAESPAKADYLRCEYRVDPLGIDVVQPRFSWEMADSRRGAKQAAYQILVAGSPEKLAANQADIWDSGKVDGDQSAQVVYAGKPLETGKRYFWKVRLWDAAGVATAYSKSAMWSMGMLKPEDVKGKWIGLEGDMTYPTQQSEGKPSPKFDGCSWVWCDEPGVNAREKAPQGERFFRGVVTVPENQKIRRAYLLVSADDAFDLTVNKAWVARSADFKKPQVIDLTSQIKPGKNVLCIMATNAMPTPAGLIGKLTVEFEQGDPLVSVIDKSWKAAVKPEGEWTAVDFDDSKWAAAVELAKFGEGPWGAIDVAGSGTPLACPLFRKEFNVQGNVRRATVYGSALGVYRLHINGKAIGKDFFTPDWTDYNKRVYYNTYDVTDLIKSNGANAIGGVLAGGWYADQIGWERKRFHYGEKPKLFAQLVLEMADGTVQTVATDGTWKTTFGPYIEGEFLAGETYDATKEIAGWDRPGLSDSAWKPVTVLDAITAKLQAFPGVTVQETGVVKTVKITEPKPGCYIFDLGQNFAGFAKLKAIGPAGTKIVLRYAEVLNPDGTIYITNLRSARATDTYVMKGQGEGSQQAVRQPGRRKVRVGNGQAEETWEPHFTFHGFRYVEVTGYPGKPTEDAITGIAINSNIPLTGTFECSSPMINRLYQNIVWTQRANYISVPTDCPQRDERLGWTGDAETFVRAGTYNADIASFYTKWLVDLEDGQGPTGDFPDVAPRVVAMGGGTAAWADAGTICPFTIYYVYNDKRLLEKHYDAMVRWVEYCRNNSKDLIRPAAGYGDWLSIKADTPTDLLATAYFAYSTHLTAEAARILGKADDAKKYDELFEQIKAAFNKAYVADDARIKGDTQTCYVLALAFNLLPEEKRATAAKYLVENIQARDNHLSTGFVGTSVLMPTLSETGNTPTAYKLLLNDTFPSWGYSIKHGATSIWERWDGWTAEKGFQDPGMNSFAHYSFGAVSRWMFQTAAGIDTAAPGFQQLKIRPQPGEGLDWVKASYRSLHGKIATEWKKSGDKLMVNITVPANTTATVYLPVGDAAAVTENGKPVAKSEGVKFLRTEGGESLFEVGAGAYQFAMPASK
jgi:alpha-L-rhamnosidase